MDMIQGNAKESRYFQRFIAFFVAIFLVLACVSMFIIARMNQNQVSHRQFLLKSKASDIEDQINMMIARVQTMRFMVLATEGEGDSFDELAPLVMQGWDTGDAAMIKNIALAPGGIVSKVYPLKGNETLLGYDLWEAAQPNPQTVKTLKNGKVHITPPIELMQGGNGMIISLPVTLHGETESWGMVAVVIDAEKLMNAFMLGDFLTHQMEYSLSYQELNGHYVELVTSGRPVVKPVTYTFKTENLQWKLSVSGTMDSGSIFTIVLLVVALVIVSLLLATVLADQKRRKQMNHMFHELANTDNVTGCNTRHFVYEKLVDKETGAWRYEGLQYSLAILDVDNFKQVNDTWGHDVGDEILQRIAQILLNSLSRNKGDCAIRFGGDEFVLLFGERTQEQMRDILYHVLAKVREMRLADYPDIKVTVSIGGVHPDQITEEATYIHMLRAADEKLYRAKEEGRNRCVL